ncbi:MAG TPA: hypothetical protein VGR28_02765 [Candidatus Thermoplasmatota archaeon]|jgi:hypothetical protein|nr:hypothetical protein [Candidatus Thermoplasmatota archaeon]
MRSLPLLAAIAILLAGCLGSSAPSEPASPVTPTGTDPQAADGSASPPSGAAAGAAGDGVNRATALVREYWGDRTEVVLIDDTGTVDNEGDTDVVNCLLNCFNAFFMPAEGMFVAPGTATVEVTATWTAPPTAPSMRMAFAYRTAADADEVEGEIASGETVTIQVGPGDADAPLAPASQWWFSFFPHASPAGSVTPTEIAVKAVAKRAPGDLPVFGDAPDPWKGQSRVALVQGAGGEQQILFTPQTFSCFNCRTGWDSAGGALVGEGARSLEATLSWTWPGPAKPVLHYWNAVAGDNDEVVPLATDGDTSRAFALDSIPSDQLDSPYQHRSTWGFWVSFEGGPVPAGAAVGTLSLDVSVAR